jgi:hypothetical protein
MWPSSGGRAGTSQGHEIHRLNADGSGRLRLTETPFWLPLQPESERVQWSNVSPTWSPDGREIAFLTDRNGPWEIWVMNADGSEQRPMFEAGGLDSLELSYAGVDERMLSWW